MTPLSWALLVRNIPFKFKSSSSSVSTSSTSSSDSGVVAGAGSGESEATKAADNDAIPAAVPSLRYQVCHRLLTELFLSGTSYVDTEESPEGLGRALKALRVLLDDEDDLLEVSLFELSMGQLKGSLVDRLPCAVVLEYSGRVGVVLPLFYVDTLCFPSFLFDKSCLLGACKLRVEPASQREL